MNRHLRRAQAKLLEAHDRLADASARQAISDWRKDQGFVGDDALAVASSSLLDVEAWERAATDLETRGEVVALALMREHELRLTEAERDRFLVRVQIGVCRVVADFAAEVRDYCAAMAAIGEEVVSVASRP